MKAEIHMQSGACVGPYRITARIGAGGMGEVWRARDERLDRDVAIKVLPAEVAAEPERLQRFEREARAMAALSHPNVIEIHDIGVHGGEHYLVEELLEGESLRVRLADGPLTAREAVAIAAQIAKGLAAAHERRIVHRDLKPENVYLTSRDLVKIIDFGLAKSVTPVSDPGADTITHEPDDTTEPGRVMGTVAYMAPEQARGQAIDHRADIFAFGVILYEMLAGVRPFRGETTTDVIASLLKDQPPPLPLTVPSPLRNIVARCLEKRPEDRFDSAHDLALVLQAPQSRDAPLQTGSTGPRRLPVARRLAFWLAGALALTVGALAVAWLASRGEPESLPRSNSRQLTSAPGWEAEPALSPDGSLVAYASNESGNPDIWLIDVRGGSSLQLTDNPASDRHPAWLPDGAGLVFVSDRSGESAIWRMPRLGGTPILVMPNAEDPAISPDGSSIAFARTGTSGMSRIAVAPLDEPAQGKFVTGEEDGLWDHRNPSWSPDGRTLCYADFRDLWLVSSAGGDARRLTTDHETDMEPVWSGDGRWIYFSSMRGGTTALWRVPASDGSPQRLSMGTGPEREPSLSRDGSRLAYSTYVYNLDVVVLDRRSGQRSRLPGLKLDFTPAVAPDGSAVVFSSDRAGKSDLWSQRLEAGSPVGRPIRLTDQQGSTAMATFSPDGRWIAYSRVLGDERDIWAIPRGGGLPQRLTDHPGIDIHPAFSPDGSRLAFVSDRGGGQNVWVAEIGDGMRLGAIRRITSGELPDSCPTWSPDGQQLAYVSGSEVWIVGVAPGSLPRRVTQGAQAEVARWDPSGNDLLVSGVWGTEKLQIRRVSVLGGSSRPLEPPVILGDARSQGGVFGVAADGGVLAYQLDEVKGDLWLAETNGGGPMTLAAGARRRAAVH